MKLHISNSALTVFLFLLLFSEASADLNSDKQALLDFAEKVPHARKINWNASTSVCNSWFGITCDASKTRVVAVRLPGVGLSGSIPGNGGIEKLDALRILSLRSNFLSGNLPSSVTSIPSLRYLFLQENKFSGPLPEVLSPGLNVLDLSRNSFTGNFSGSLQNLTRLTVLNLAENSLSGPIPDIQLPRLKLLNLSYNDFNGEIPYLLRKFPDSSFSGNPSLCGEPLKSCNINPSPSPNQPTTPPISQKGKKLGSGTVTAITIGVCGVMILLLVVIILYFLKRVDREPKNGDNSKAKKAAGDEMKSADFGSGVQGAEKNKLFFFGNCSYSFDLEDLLRASAEVLGKGSFGSTYKAVLEDGTMVVVKRLKDVFGVSKKDFEQQMEIFWKLGADQQNVVPVRAYYYSKDEKLLVFDYFPVGSLFMALRGNQTESGTALDWNSRVKIALGTAKGLSQIHSAKCVHGNIKSSNILLKQDLEPAVCDAGLAPLMNIPTNNIRVIGYRAPEVLETGKYTIKSDVYSFGVLLLELLTGKAPLQNSGHDDVVDLPRWVRSVVREEWTAEVFDVELLKYRNVEEDMVQMLQIALACVAKNPEIRPNLVDVVRMIEGILQPEKERASSGTETDQSNVQTP